MRLSSEYPFPPRQGGPQDEFQHHALKQLRDEPNESVAKFEQLEGKAVLRYATARAMKTSCLDCHNSVANKPPGGWKVGDVRGVLELIRPLDNEIMQTRSGLRETYLWIAAVGALGVALSWVVFTKAS